MPIEFRCPQCGKLLRTPDTSAGKKGKCPHCQSVNDIPLASTAVAEKPADSAAQSPAPFSAPTTDPFANDPFAAATGTTPFSAGPVTSDPFATAPHSAPTSPGQTDLFADLPGTTPYAAGPAPYAAGPANPFEPKPGPLPGPADPFGAPAPASSNPYAAPTYAASQPSYGYHSGAQPHRGGMVLALGIIGLLTGIGGMASCCCCLFLPLEVVSLAVGIPAIVLGHVDLRKMREGVMDPSGHGMTMTGYVMGIVAVALVLLGVLGFIVWIAINGMGAAFQGMQNQGQRF